METTYELMTLRDVYEKVPRDKLALCMREIAEGMEHVKELEELVSVSAAAEGASAETIWPISCTWIDDGTESKTITVTDAATGDEVFTLEVLKTPNVKLSGCEAVRSNDC